MAEQNPTWQQVCQRLWGPDWVKPVSEVLGVNRKTIERWRDGITPIPDAIDEMFLVQQSTPDDRAYGAILRRIANGETPDEIAAEMKLGFDALNRLQAQLDAEDWIASLAARQKVKQ
ncbi:hypothetical protein [Aureimonas glaciei]|uniref:Uncharacterized protein n=1 Tax=Aureimonas glaciei TaxID=1776957 RepID=A0A916YCJ9_9HYPH|nr:hypothetical protein [Aureimonas glaciei]GGD38310.1 hypothetical protein GCM10011335_46320 [Aureimonas glaciei]